MLTARWKITLELKKRQLNLVDTKAAPRESCWSNNDQSESHQHGGGEGSGKEEARPPGRLRWDPHGRDRPCGRQRQHRGTGVAVPGNSEQIASVGKGQGAKRNKSLCKARADSRSRARPPARPPGDCTILVFPRLPAFSWKCIFKGFPFLFRLNFVKKVAVGIFSMLG